MFMALSVRTLRSPVGRWTVVGDDDGVARVFMPNEEAPERTRSASPAVLDAAQQLEEYFAGRRRDFELAFAPVRASEFQRQVWDALCEVPYGHVITYAELARRVGRPRAARAVGTANHANPWPVLVPCHRVVAQSGLGGYGGGPDVKRFLLRLEGVTAYG